jgi:hypothetical protein
MNTKPNYLNRRLIILIPLVGILIVGVSLISNGIADTQKTLGLFIHGIVMTAGIWLGCMTIVMYLWTRFPWEQAPLRHLILEILFILLYTLTFSSILYLLERKFWNIPRIENAGMQIFTTLLITFFITSVHESIFFTGSGNITFPNL